MIFCCYIKALSYSVSSERIINEFVKAIHPDFECLKKAQNNLIEASKICEFIANMGINLLPKNLKNTSESIPELNMNIMSAIAKLFYAEAQLVAFERGCLDPIKKLSYSARSSLLKDISSLLKTSWELIEKGMGDLKHNAKSHMKEYYFNFIKGLTIFCEGLSWFNFGLSFQEKQPNNEDNNESRKLRLGCGKKCIEIMKEFEDKYFKKLDKHKEYFEKHMKLMFEQLQSFF